MHSPACMSLDENSDLHKQKRVKRTLTERQAKVINQFNGNLVDRQVVNPTNKEKQSRPRCENATNKINVSSG